MVDESVNNADNGEVGKPSWNPVNPHDRFARKTIGNPIYATDFIRCYAEPVVAETINLDKLEVAQTHFLSERLKEIILDIPFVTKLRDTENDADVMIFIEHKSSPSRVVPLQLLTQALMSLYGDWTAAGYSETFVPKLPVMILLYNGAGEQKRELTFQGMFPNVPAGLRLIVPQFRVVVIDMQAFDYDKLPGNLVSQAIAESFKRATDGTFAEHFEDVLRRIWLGSKCLI
ncbi:MAG: Rpn family recombination-promoting nuclease/putative transposase [Planctomycetaceae bacterium]|jgi:hypothetical protein|nr:Rpn family recombination-promoting nuclease/putative transposase [Planctomycetaceae bacterium]